MVCCLNPRFHIRDCFYALCESNKEIENVNIRAWFHMRMWFPNVTRRTVLCSDWCELDGWICIFATQGDNILDSTVWFIQLLILTIFLILQQLASQCCAVPLDLCQCPLSGQHLVSTNNINTNRSCILLSLNFSNLVRASCKEVLHVNFDDI